MTAVVAAKLEKVKGIPGAPFLACDASCNILAHPTATDEVALYSCKGGELVHLRTVTVGKTLRNGVQGVAMTGTHFLVWGDEPPEFYCCALVYSLADGSPSGRFDFGPGNFVFAAVSGKKASGLETCLAFSAGHSIVVVDVGTQIKCALTFQTGNGVTFPSFLEGTSYLLGVGNGDHAVFVARVNLEGKSSVLSRRSAWEDAWDDGHAAAVSAGATDEGTTAHVAVVTRRNRAPNRRLVILRVDNLSHEGDDASVHVVGRLDGQFPAGDKYNFMVHVSQEAGVWLATPTRFDVFNPRTAATIRSLSVDTNGRPRCPPLWDSTNNRLVWSSGQRTYSASTLDVDLTLPESGGQGDQDQGDAEAKGGEGDGPKKRPRHE